MPESTQQGRRLRVALDGTPLLGPITGIGLTVRELLRSLVAFEDLDLRAYAVTLRGRDGLAAKVPEGVRTSQRAMPARPLMAAWARSSHPRIERFIGPVDVVHGTNFVVPPSKRAGRVVTVNDLTFVRFPELCEPATLRFGRLVARAVERGAIVHVPSQFIAAEIRATYGAAREQVTVVGWGTPPLASPDLVGAAAVIEDGQPFILSIGTAEPRKDLPSLVRAFGLLSAEDPELRLLLVGPRGWGEDALSAAIGELEHPGRVMRAGYVDDGVLSALLGRARALAYPSLYEGFGLPPLQAMAAGTPVVTTRAGSITEVAGGAALLVDPGDVEDLAAALAVAVYDEAQRGVLITAGRARVEDFTWEKTARGLVEIYRRAAGQ
jgi:glycosyltransferase involved in cell wall biosynthesis